MFIEGERLIESCLQSPVGLVSCYYSPEPTPRTSLLLAELARRGCPLFATAEAVMATLSDTVHPQGIILIAERPNHGLKAVLGADGAIPLVVGIDAIQDPGNFGAIVRTAEAAGATGILALRGSVDAFAPKTLRSAMGSAFRLPVVEDLEPAEIRDFARRHGLILIATAAVGSIDYTGHDWTEPSIIFFGNEGNGMRPEMMELCDRRVRIRLQAPVESLNVGAAAAVILFEAARQRRRDQG
jgi:TrmH family RNA methyltransferase